MKILKDQQWEPDEEFYIELIDSETRKRLIGNDTLCKITVIDDAKPGFIKIKNNIRKVHKG